MEENSENQENISAMIQKDKENGENKYLHIFMVKPCNTFQQHGRFLVNVLISLFVGNVLISLSVCLHNHHTPVLKAARYIEFVLEFDPTLGHVRALSPF